MRESSRFSTGTSSRLLVLHAVIGAAAGGGVASLHGSAVTAIALAAALMGMLAALARDNASTYLLRDVIVLPGMLLGFLGSGVCAVLEGRPLHQGLAMSLAGLTFGFAVPWIARAVASRAFRREALGLGDVKAQAMIGSFLGPTNLVGFWICLICAFLLAMAALRPKGNMPTGYLYLGAALIATGVGSSRWGELIPIFS